ncbi:MAG: peptide-N-glycosidase F-related protein [Saprospiraceae bacterium]
MNRLFFFILLFFISNVLSAQITEVRTFNFDSSSKRDTMIDFPDIETEKIIMLYTMRCKDGLVSTGTDRNKGCGEWDYSCNTFVTDSSRIDSSLATAPSHIISNFSGNFFNFVNLPTYTYIQRELKNVVETGITGETKKTVGNGVLPVIMGNTQAAAQRQLYLFTKEELASFGGKLVAIELEVKKGGGSLSYFRIRLAETDATTVAGYYDPTASTTEVKYENIAIPASGVLRLPFYSPFTWSGSKNLLVTFDYVSEGNDIELAGHQIQIERTAISNQGDQFWKSDGSSGLQIPTDEAQAIRDEITIAFWSFGNFAVLPANTAVLEAVDDNNNRQLMIHLPWSNSNVYWDCGNDGTGYNRINKAALNPEFEGKWHFWTFTKNAVTGSMKIYLDGVLWHSGTGMTKKIDIKKMRFGGSLDRSLHYPGFLDDLTIWNKELDVNAIKTLMFNRLDGSHPNYLNLLYYYHFDQNQGLTIDDASFPSTQAEFSNAPAFEAFLPGQLFKNYKATAFRPNTTFIKGNINVDVNEIVVRDSIANVAHQVRTFYVENNNLREGTTLHLWEAGEYPVYDENGEQVDVVFTEADSSIFIEDLIYYQKRPMKFELMSFVTPYGIGLDLGLEGKTWHFDVSDFAPILKGRKRMTMEFGGQNQEEMDIRFLYYSGKAPRKVLDIRQVWPVNAVGYNSILSNNSFEKRQVQFNSLTQSAKLRSAITGHGQEGEFIPQTHFINVNGGNTEWSWQVWKECADNPVYPQGGTWIYDRAGWCPGAATDVREYDVSPYISNTGMDIDYGINTAQGDSRYIVNTQLVEYGQAEFNVDAAITKIVRPSMDIEHQRFNPICMQPAIVIRNGGKETLTKIIIEYGTDNQILGQHEWTGNLQFMQTTLLDLPVLSPSAWSDSGTFFARIVEVNGVNDEYVSNNELTSSYTSVSRHTSNIIIDMRTNGAANETSWVLTDVDGNIIKQRKGALSPNKDYADTIRNLNGCYLLKISDTGDDGISFWANGDGTGYLGIRSIGQPVKQFNGDFGKEINYQFIASSPSGNNEEIQVSAELSVYPNPANQSIELECSGIKEKGNLYLMDSYGRSKLVGQHTGELNSIYRFDLTDFPAGPYFIRFVGIKNVKTIGFVKI